MNKVPSIQARMMKTAQLMPMGDAAQTATDIISIIHFLMQRVPPSNHRRYVDNLRSKIWNMNELEISNKVMTSGSAIGQSITFIKNILMGQNPAYVRSVLKQVATRL